MDQSGAVAAEEKLPEQCQLPEAAGAHAQAIDAIVKKVFEHYDVSACCFAIGTTAGITLMGGHGIDATFVPRPEKGKSILWHDINRKLPVIIYDASADARFSNDVLVVGQPYARFFIRVPVMLSDTECIGTLCLMDPEPRTYYSLEDCDLAMKAAEEIAELFTDSGLSPA